MLQIHIKDSEFFNEETFEFSTIKGQTLTLEHSLVSISKWESKWCKPFLDKKEKTTEEMYSYIECMSITPIQNPEILKSLTVSDLNKIRDYISNPMTATEIKKPKTPTKKSSSILTSELIYYEMIAFQIPFECQKWHINRLLKLIEICSIKNTPSKKMSKSEIAKRNSELNAQRRSKWNSAG